jgi:hypothetical protein
LNISHFIKAAQASVIEDTIYLFGRRYSSAFDAKHIQKTSICDAKSGLYLKALLLFEVLACVLPL